MLFAFFFFYSSRNENNFSIKLIVVVLKLPIIMTNILTIISQYLFYMLNALSIQYFNLDIPFSFYNLRHAFLHYNFKANKNILK